MGRGSGFRFWARWFCGHGHPLTSPSSCPVQDDMQVIIRQQLLSQRQKEQSATGPSLRRTTPRFSLRLGTGPGRSFLSSLFRRT